MVKYDVVLVPFFYEDDFNKYKIRPALILDDKTICFLGSKITSHTPRTYFDYQLEDLEAAGLDRPSCVRLDKTDNFKSDAVIRTIGHLSNNDIKNIEVKLNKLTNAEESLAAGEVTGEIMDYIIEKYYDVLKRLGDEDWDESPSIAQPQIKVEEDIEKHNELNQKIFNGDQLDPKVKDKLLEIVAKFKESLAADEVKLDIKDVVLVGSNVSYNYTKDSDIDLHIIADLSAYPNQEELAAKLYNAYKSLFNNKYDPTIYGIDVEVYVEPEGSKANSKGRYSLYNGWLDKPEKEDIPEQPDIKDEYKDWEARAKACKTIDDIDNFIDDVYKLRQAGLLADGEFSKENLIFKELRNNNVLSELKDKKVDLENKEMSLTEEIIDKDIFNQLDKDEQDYIDKYDLSIKRQGDKYILGDAYAEEVYDTLDDVRAALQYDISQSVEESYLYCEDLPVNSMYSAGVLVNSCLPLKEDNELNAGGVIVLSDKVDAINLSPDKITNSLKQIMATLKTKLTRLDLHKSLMNDYEIPGVSVGHTFKGSYRGNDGRSFSGDSYTIEILGVDNELLDKIAKDLCKKLHQESALVRYYDGSNPKYIGTAYVWEIDYTDNGEHKHTQINAPSAEYAKQAILHSCKDATDIKVWTKESLEESTQEDIKAQALANYLGISVEAVDENDDIYDTPEGEYLVLTDKEADQYAYDDITSLLDDIGLDAFTPDFKEDIIHHYIDKSFINDFIEEEIEYFSTEEPDEDMVDYLTYMSDEEATQYFLDTFEGYDSAQFASYLLEHNALDIDSIIDECISLDGRGHFISTYDGEEIELSGNLFAYRV